MIYSDILGKLTTGMVELCPHSSPFYLNRFFHLDYRSPINCQKNYVYRVFFNNKCRPESLWDHEFL